MSIEESDLIESQENLFQYFIQLGNKPSDIDNPPNNDILSLTPEILSSYSIEGDSKEFITLKENLSDPIYLYTIFPKKVDALFSDVDLEQNEFNLKPFYPIYENYYYECNERPSPFFHCFNFKNQIEGDFLNDYDWFFNCLLYYNKINSNENKYLARALIIISHEPYFNLCKQLLESIYNKILLIEGNNSFPCPIEYYITKIFKNVKKYNINGSVTLNIDNEINYTLITNPFLSVCDLNLATFFHIFDFKAYLVLTEYFFKQQSIIITSPYVEILYPIYYLFMCCIHPLDITDNTYFYRFLNPNLFEYILLSDFPCLLFINSDGLPQKLLERIVKDKRDLCYVSINKDEKGDYYCKEKSLFKYKEKEEQIEKYNFPNNPLILKILKVSQVKGEGEIINQLLMMIITETTSLNSDKNRNKVFFQKDDIDLRNNLFGLMLYFLTSIIEKINFCVNDNGELIIEAHKISSLQSSNNKLEVSKNEIDELETSSMFEILHKNKLTIDNINFKTLGFKILLDEFIKIYRIDQYRIYYEINYKKIKNKKVTIDCRKINELEKLVEEYENFYIQNKEKLCNLATNKQNKLEFIYISNILNFDPYINCKILGNNKLVSKNMKKNILNVLYEEVKNFYNLYIASIIPIENKKENAMCLIGTALSLILLNEATNKKYENIKDSKNNFIYRFACLFAIFIDTEGFRNKCNFLLSFIYLIIISNKYLKQKYYEKFFSLMNDFKCVPTITILFYHNRINKNENLICEDKPAFGISIKSQEQDNNKCEHIFNPFDGVKEGIICTKCKKSIYYKVKLNNSDGYEPVLLSNPLFTLKQLLREIIVRGRVDFKDINDFYDNWNDDLLLVSVFGEIYFKFVAFSNICK